MLWITLPVCYVITSFSLLFFLGGAGHGRGPLYFYYLSAPLSLLIPDSGFALWLTLFAGILQYAVVGCLLDRWRKRRTGK